MSRQSQDAEGNPVPVTIDARPRKVPTILGAAESIGMERVRSIEDLMAERTWAARLALRLTGRADEAEDLVQDAYEASMRRPPPAHVPFGAWLVGILRRRHSNAERADLRRAQREKEAGRDLDASPPTDVLAERLETQRLLAGLVLALEPDRREAVLLRYYEGLTSVEIAARLGVPAGTIRWRLNCALNDLRRQLDSGERRGAWAPSVSALTILPRVAANQGFWSTWVVTAVATSTLILAGATTYFGRRSTQAAPIAAVSESAGEPTPSRTPSRPPVRNVGAFRAMAAPSVTAVMAVEPDRFYVPLGVGPIRGPSDAMVTMIMFLDYECPFCVRIRATVESLLAKYPRDLRFQIVNAPLPFHKHAALAARALISSGLQGRYWQMHNRVLTNKGQALEREDLMAHAQAVGLDIARFSRDLDSEQVNLLLESDLASARSLGVTGTPISFINGRRLAGAQPDHAFITLIEQELVHARDRLARGVRPEALYNEIIKEYAVAVPSVTKRPMPKDLPMVPRDRDAITRCFRNADEMKLIEGATFHEGNWITPRNPGHRGREVAKCVSGALKGESLRFRAKNLE